MTNEPPKNDNIIKFTPRISESKTLKKKHPPMFNIPPVTKILTGLILGIHLLLWVTGLLFIDNINQYVAVFGGFIAGSWTGDVPFAWWSILTPLTSIFLHGSWMHVGVNALMLVAIGSGTEKWMGKKRYLIIFFASCVIALLTHIAFDPFSNTPIIGASGGISGLFGAILLAMRTGASPTMNPNMMPVILLWVGISALIGILGAPDGSSVAWVAHIGGFIGGIGIAALMFRKQKR